MEQAPTAGTRNVPAKDPPDGARSLHSISMQTPDTHLDAQGTLFTATRKAPVNVSVGCAR